MQLQAKGFQSTVKSSQAIRTYIKRSIMNPLFPHPPRNLLAAADNIRSASGSPIRSLRFLRGLHPPRTETCNYFRSASGAFLFSSPPLSLSRFSSSTCLKSFSVLISSLADASFYCSAHWRALGSREGNN